MKERHRTQIPRLLSPGEVADVLNVSRSLVYQLIESGKLACHRIGTGRGAIRVSEHDLADFLIETRSVRVEEAQRPPRRKLKHLKIG
jgi:excisionase family DNA binding protein